MANIILKDKNGDNITYEDVKVVSLNTDEGTKALYLSEEDFISLPAVTGNDNGKIPKVVDGEWKLANDEVGSGEGASGPVDWYNIKNNPFGEVQVEIIPNKSYPFAFDSQFSTYAWSSAYDQTFKVSELIEDRDYVVNWDGTTYNCTAAPLTYQGMSGIYIGNASLFGGAGNDEPFVIAHIVNYTGEFLVILIVGGDNPTAESHVVQVYTKDMDKIDEKYLPDSLFDGSTTGPVEQVQSDWDEKDETSPAFIKNKPVIGTDGSVSIQPDYAENDSSSASYIKNRPFYDIKAPEDIEYFNLDNAQFTFIEDLGFNTCFCGIGEDIISAGDVYTVVWNGETYFCECVLMPGLGLPVLGNYNALAGTGQTNEPFAIAMDAAGAAFGAPQYIILDTSASTTTTTNSIQLSKHTEFVEKIPARFLHKADWNEKDTNSANYIQNKPFYEYTDKVIEWDGVIGTKDSIQLEQGLIYVKVSDTPMASDELVGKYFSFAGVNEIITSEKCNDMNGCIAVMSTEIFHSEAPVIMSVPFDQVNLGVAIATKGLWLLSYLEMNYVSSIANITLKKIDSKFLPDDISGLPESTSDDNGKVLTVNTVGEPVWTTPATGLPDVTSYDNGMILSVDNGVWTKTVNPLPKTSTSDNGKTLKVVNGAWSLTNEKLLPNAVEADEGKFLRIVNGVPTWTAIQNAEEVTF